jgi:hypothetical protein
MAIRRIPALKTEMVTLVLEGLGDSKGRGAEEALFSGVVLEGLGEKMPLTTSRIGRLSRDRPLGQSKPVGLIFLSRRPTTPGKSGAS